MKRKLRGLVESIVTNVLSEVAWEGYEGEDLEATCNHCNQPLWLVWEPGNPAHKWTECGGMGEGSCEARWGDEDEEKPLTKRSAVDDAPPPTMRSPVHPNASTKVKKSV